MKKNELLKKDGDVIRILEVDGEEVFYFLCRGMESPMPKWGNASEFKECLSCTEEELLEQQGMELVPEEELEAKERNAARQRYAIIAPVIACLEDEAVRSQMIGKTAQEHGITKQTIRNYLKMYLTYNSVSALVPKHRTAKEKPMTDDERNFRWAVNKYVYSRKKNSLNTAYKLMLKEKYTDNEGDLLEEYPSFNQFRYWYSKNKNYMSYYISREGKTGFMRNHRVCIGDNVQTFAMAPGVGMADSTIVDLYIVSDDRSSVIGRPILTAILDGYSYLCLGYSLGWEGGEYSLQSLMLNIATDKKRHCKKFGIGISEDEWPSAMPGCILTDRGSEYAGETYGQLAELGIRIVNLEAYRADEKGVVEKFFDIIQNFFKPYLKGAGVVAEEYYERGSYFGDFKEKSCLTLREFETILLRCIIHYNSRHILRNFPFTEEMIELGVKPYSNCIWQYGLQYLRGCNVLPDVTKEQIILCLLPRTTGSFSRFGLKVNGGMRYFCEGFFERCLKGGKAIVAYDREDVSSVWLYEDGKYTRFDLIESIYQGMDLEAVVKMKERKKELIEKEQKESLQSEINLVSHIEAIKHNALAGSSPDVKNMRESREGERKRKHVNHAREAGLYDE